MYKKVKGKDVHIYGIENIDGSTLNQFYEAVAQEYVTRAALMSDAHKGYALPIGGVVSCKGVIVPAYVGYDIGCGMTAMKLKGVGITTIKRNRDKIFDEIYERIPVGFNHRKQDFGSYLWQDKPMSDFLKRNLVERNALRQIGTLGGGNHFIEIGYDSIGDKSIWIIVHSGSRGIGHDTGTHYMRIAGGGKVREGHYPLDVLSTDGINYINDMNICLEFALQSRNIMINEVVDVITDVTGNDVKSGEHFINRNHNHAEFKDDEWIHRKGATHAEFDMLGVIPGNMRDGSFIVRGKGCDDSLCSSSHGAGRLYSRTKAKKVLSIDEFRRDMSDIKAKVDKSTLDESSGAYKDIYNVMENQEDLVEVIAHIKPLVNIKG